MLVMRSRSALFVAPDNGLLTPFLEAAVSVRSVERSDLFLPGPGQTFHGRDRFAPVAASLLRGEPEEGLGPEIPDPVRLTYTTPRRSGNRIAGRILHIDRYGNLVTDIPVSWLPPSDCRAEVGGYSIARRASHYAAIPAGEAALVPGSLGTIELSMNGESLAFHWGIPRGTLVDIIWNES
jgi:S-adenosylmethionine hydrolase